MFQPQVDTQVLRDVSWWHWAITVQLLAAHLAGYPGMLIGAIGLCAIAGGYFGFRVRGWRPYPVQVRLAYLGLLLLGLVPGFGWLHFVQLIGTSAMVLVGYCPLGRLLSLMPLNRHEPLSWSLVARAVTAHPTGGIVELGPAVADGPSPACCSLQRGARPAANG